MLKRIVEFLQNIGKCRWKHDETHGMWETACGQAHCFGEGGIEENNYVFCPYCGSMILEVEDWDTLNGDEVTA